MNNEFLRCPRCGGFDNTSRAIDCYICGSLADGAATEERQRKSERPVLMESPDSCAGLRPSMPSLGNDFGPQSSQKAGLYFPRWLMAIGVGLLIGNISDVYFHLVSPPFFWVVGILTGFGAAVLISDGIER